MPPHRWNRRAGRRGTRLAERGLPPDAHRGQDYRDHDEETQDEFHHSTGPFRAADLRKCATRLAAQFRWVWKSDPPTHARYALSVGIILNLPTCVQGAHVEEIMAGRDDRRQAVQVSKQRSEPRLNETHFPNKRDRPGKLGGIAARSCGDSVQADANSRLGCFATSSRRLVALPPGIKGRGGQSHR
jgi:hypothetical protein